MTLTFYRDIDDRWRWSLASANGRILADSGQSYSRYADAEHGAQLTTDHLNRGITVRVLRDNREEPRS